MRVLLGLVIVAAAAGTNLLVNPGFEEWPDDSTPAGWAVESRTRTAVYKEADTAYSGLLSTRLVRRNLSPGDNYGLKQQVLVSPGTSLRYSVWCWDDSPELAIGVGVTWRRADSSYISAAGIAYSTDSSGWCLVCDTAAAPAEAALADFRIRTHAPSGMTGEGRALVDCAWFGPLLAEPDTVCAWFAEDSLGQLLVGFFDRAQASIDYCCYNSTRTDVVQALIRAVDRGVAVRVITDNNRLGNAWVDELRSAGIPVWSDSVGPNSANYMHNKFAVRDLADSDTTNDRVWVASYNPNQGELRADCALDIPGTGVASAYRAEFEQMWGGSGFVPNPDSARFHDAKQDVLVTHEFEVAGWPVLVFFGPQDRPVDTIASLAGSATSHLLFGVFAFTHDGLGDTMVRLWNDSVWVGGVIDKSGAGNQGSVYDSLVAHGLPVFIDSVGFGEGILHEKTMVIDSTITVAGSANWSNNGNRDNDENVVVLHDPRVAARFLAELHERFREATNPGVSERRAWRYQGRPLLASPVRQPLLLPEGATLHDATGRQVKAGARLAPGVYFIRGHSVVSSQHSGPARAVVLK